MLAGTVGLSRFHDRDTVVARAREPPNHRERAHTRVAALRAHFETFAKAPELAKGFGAQQGWSSAKSRGFFDERATAIGELGHRARDDVGETL